VPDSPRHASAGSRGPGDALVRAGALLFAVGGVGVLLTVLPYFVGEREPALPSLVVASLMPFGLALALLGLLRAARASRRQS